mmetsp:Transcript_22113/g.69181  ORF Transcript_22113/g.69181 Transcript_22113/m.69181 type:complete len:328 (+) Transcript_22113:212-1195(+)
MADDEGRVTSFNHAVDVLVRGFAGPGALDATGDKVWTGESEQQHKRRVQEFVQRCGFPTNQVQYLFLAAVTCTYMVPRKAVVIAHGDNQRTLQQMSPVYLGSLAVILYGPSHSGKSQLTSGIFDTFTQVNNAKKVWIENKGESESAALSTQDSTSTTTPPDAVHDDSFLGRRTWFMEVVSALGKITHLFNLFQDGMDFLVFTSEVLSVKTLLQDQSWRDAFKKATQRENQSITRADAKTNKSVTRGGYGCMGVAAAAQPHALFDLVKQPGARLPLNWTGPSNGFFLWNLRAKRGERPGSCSCHAASSEGLASSRATVSCTRPRCRRQ